MTSLLQDVYPSRQSEKPILRPRRDPVLWPSSHPRFSSGLSADQLSQFESQGFIVLPDLLTSDDVGSLLEEIARLGESEDIRGSEACIYEPSSGTVRSLFDIHRLSKLFSRLVADERIIIPAMQILGSEVYVHQSRVNLKPGFRGEQFYWHSDFETWHVEDGMPRMRAVSCSILLTENNPFNGPLMLIPGSHRTFVGCVGQTPENHYRHSLRKQEYGVPDDESLTRLVQEGGIVAPTGRAGSVLLFDCNTMHGSAGNISPWPRSNFFCVYNSMANMLEPPFGGMEPRPDFIACRQAAAISPCKDFARA